MTCIWNKTFTDNVSRFKIRFPELYKLVETEIQKVKFNFEQYEKQINHRSLPEDKEAILEILNSVFFAQKL